MSYGFLAKNTSGSILVSDVMKNLHLKEKITDPTSISVPFTFMNGITKFTYQFTCSSTPVPFFTMPFTDRFYCMTGMKNISGNTWQVEIQSSGGFPTGTGSTAGTTTSATGTREPSSGSFYNSNSLFFIGNCDGTQPYYYGIIICDHSSSSGTTNNRKVSVYWNNSSCSNTPSFTVPYSTGSGGSSGFSVPSLVDPSGDYTYYLVDANNNDVTSLHQTPAEQVVAVNGASHSVGLYFYRIYRVSNTVSGGSSSSGNSPSGSYTTAQTPTLYVFADPSAITASGNHGMQIKNSNGDVGFDSRMRPLQISSTVNITHPTEASTASANGLSARNCSSNHSTNFIPDKFTDHTTSTQPNSPMFFFSSLSQRHHEQSITEVETECDGLELKGNCLGVSRDYNWRSTYWAFYRCALKRTSSTNLRAGWITNEQACYHSRSLNSSFFGIDGLSPDSSAQGDGKHPWNDDNINNAQNTCIIANSSLYD